MCMFLSILEDIIAGPKAVDESRQDIKPIISDSGQIEL